MTSIGGNPETPSPDRVWRRGNDDDPGVARRPASRGWFQTQSLRARLLLPTLTLSTLVMVIAAVLCATLMARNLHANFVQQTTRTIDMIAHASAAYIANLDLMALGTFVDAIRHEEQAVFAEFVDGEGRSLTAHTAKSVAAAPGVLVIEREMKDGAGKVIGKLRAGFRDDDVRRARNQLIAVIAGSMLLVLAVVTGLLLWSVRRVMTTIGGEPAAAVAVADGIAGGDLVREVRAAGSGSLMSALGRMQQQLRQIVGSIREASASIQTSSSEIAQGHADLSQRTERQATALEQTAAAMEQMTATVTQNAESAREASGHASAAADVAARGGQAVGAVVNTMTGISTSSKRIAEIIGVIDSIAFQTNILALNASVEAARAGEQGRGFAVVASEVRNLAQRSATASKEIRELIAESVSRIDAGSRQVAEAGKTMDEIVAAVQRVNGLIAGISASSQEQSSNLSQVSLTVQQLEKVTQQNAAMVEQATAASASLEDQATALTRAVGNFKLAGDMGELQSSVVLRMPVRAAIGRV